MLVFLMSKPDLSDGLASTVKLFEDDTLLFSIVYDPNRSADQLDKKKKNQIVHTNEKWYLIHTYSSKHKLHFPEKLTR